MTFRKVAVFVALLGLAGTGAFAQTATATHPVTFNVPAIAMMQLDTVTTVTLAVGNPASAGLSPVGATDATKHLWYTTLNTAATTRRITVEWAVTDTAPAGTSLDIQATAVTAGCGTGAGLLTMTDLDATAQDFVTGIPSCATGQAANGATITYTLNVDTPADLVIETHTVNILFTLTEDA
jgi:hypothetical protein